jgi:hypothetical protein
MNPEIDPAVTLLLERVDDLSQWERAELNLHAVNDEQAALAYWCEAVALPPSDSNRTFIKPDGPGHRRTHLQHGVIRVRARWSTDHFVRTVGWTDGLRSVWKSPATRD